MLATYLLSGILLLHVNIQLFSQEIEKGEQFHSDNFTGNYPDLPQINFEENDMGRPGNYFSVLPATVSFQNPNTNTRVIKTTSESISVYPNPIINGIINLQLTNQPPGEYGISLINKLGLVTISGKINHEEGSGTETIHLDRYSARGIYQLEVSGPDGCITNVNVIY